MSITLKTLSLVRSTLTTAKADAQRQEFKPAYILHKLNETLTGLHIITSQTSENRAHKAPALKIINDAKLTSKHGASYESLIQALDVKISALPSAIDIMRKG